MKHGSDFKGKMHSNMGSSGLSQAKARNPNSGQHGVNDSPDGPYSPTLGVDGHSGMHGDTTVSGKHGETYHFR